MEPNSFSELLQNTYILNTYTTYTLTIVISQEVVVYQFYIVTFSVIFIN